MYEVFMVYVLEHASIHPYIYDTYSSTPSNSSTAHHLFAVWNGDRRLQEKFGDRANIIRDRTSVIPFAAILSGKQQLPPRVHTTTLSSYSGRECGCIFRTSVHAGRCSFVEVVEENIIFILFFISI